MDNQAPYPAETGASPSALGDLASPWQLVLAIQDWQMAWFRCWPCLLFQQAYPPHPHEVAGQLEIPDPIEATGERGLFA